ncbi:MAG: hypothetical protein NUV46_04830 [Nanoarchaeota archaeon]|nr:hypothetical protein [Nanoarchaeota archaeon]
MKKKNSQIKGTPVHIKLDSYEAIEGKKDLLSSEISLLKISRSLSNYKRLRSDELSKKQLIRKKFSEVKKDLTKIQNLLPILKLPKILQKSESPSEEEDEELKLEISPIKSYDIENQLREIQKKLERLPGYSS